MAFVLPNTVAALLRTGNHTISALAIRADGTSTPLPGGPMCVTPFRRRCFFPVSCHCGAPVPPAVQISNSLGCVVQDNSCYGRPCPGTPPCAATIEGAEWSSEEHAVIPIVTQH